MRRIAFGALVLGLVAACSAFGGTDTEPPTPAAETPDAGAETSDLDGEIAHDAEAGPTSKASIACRKDTCTNGEVCCATTSPGGGVCKLPDACGADDEAKVFCDGPEDCAGAICCVRYINQTAVALVACASTCDGANAERVCNAQDPDYCGGKACVPLAGYRPVSITLPLTVCEK